MKFLFSRMIYRTVMLLAVLITISACTINRENADGSKFQEAKMLWQAVPFYSGMTEIDSSFTSTASQAIIVKKYKCPASFNDVKEFYTERLPQAGWRFIKDAEIKDRGRIREERLLQFQQNGYQLLIQSAGTRSEELGWDYAIEISYPADWRQRIL